MSALLRPRMSDWTVVVPVLAVVLLLVTWNRELPGLLVAVVAAFLAGAVLAAVHHAEVVAHRVGEPFGSLVLAVAVTVIEVALIVTLMISGGDKTQALARDTVFAAVMITCNGILGLSLLVGALPPAGGGVQRRGHRRGAGHRGHPRHAQPGAADASPPASPARSSPPPSSPSPPWPRSCSTGCS